ncbi:MAG: stage II sporulation protein R [Clostridia bacterium]|nr:stage II sporulation protein R [Clostridia bacterium]
MKKFCIIFLLSIIISLTALGFSGVLGAGSANGASMYATNAQADEFLRIHIRADSNESEAQNVKYYVRDKVVEYLTPLVANYQTKAQALSGVKNHLDGIAEVAQKALYERGFYYGASAELTTERFPTRIYEDCVLPAGEYSALILRLGSGNGDNWWCVVYPPLCFSAPTGKNVTYKSKIWEIIQRFKAGK